MIDDVDIKVLSDASYRGNLEIVKYIHGLKLTGYDSNVYAYARMHHSYDIIDFLDQQKLHLNHQCYYEPTKDLKCEQTFSSLPKSKETFDTKEIPYTEQPKKNS